MFVNAGKDKQQKKHWASRLFWTLAWLVQGVLWLFLLFLVANYWLDEVPATKNYYAAGLEQGFDSLAGIVAAMDPDWTEVSRIKGYSSPMRWNRLQGETIFKVWTEQDELPGWNSGLASLRFDNKGRLVWARRYFVSAPPVYATNRAGDASFPVIKPRTDLRQAGAGGGR